jgi:hypothetical protein
LETTTNALAAQPDIGLARDHPLGPRFVTPLFIGSGISTSGVVLSTLRDAADQDYRLFAPYHRVMITADRITLTSTRMKALAGDRWFNAHGPYNAYRRHGRSSTQPLKRKLVWSLLGKKPARRYRLNEPPH